MCDLMSTHQIFRELSAGGPAKVCGQGRYTHTWNTYRSHQGQMTAPLPAWAGDLVEAPYHQVAGWCPQGMVSYQVLGAG